MLQAIGAPVKRLIAAIPLFGALLDAERKHFKTAGKELFWTTAAATLPLWFFPLVASLLFDDTFAFTADVGRTLYQGELYLYSAAIVGPILFALTTNYAEWDSDSPNAPRIGRLTFLFPYGTWFILISFAISLLSSILFGVVRFTNAGLIKAELNLDAILVGSVFMYVFTNICLYLVMVYKSELVKVASSTKTDEKDFVSNFVQKRGGGK